MERRQHLHRDDVPSALSILSDLLDHRASFPDGYEPSECGAWVDWDGLALSRLSSTEMAAVHIARGCAIAERHGGLPLEVAGSVRVAVEELTGGWTATPDPIDLAGPGAEGRFDEQGDPAWGCILTAQRHGERHRPVEIAPAPDDRPGVDQ